MLQVKFWLQRVKYLSAQSAASDYLRDRQVLDSTGGGA
jgi:hypothetical protein